MEKKSYEIGKDKCIIIYIYIYIYIYHIYIHTHQQYTNFAVYFHCFLLLSSMTQSMFMVYLLVYYDRNPLIFDDIPGKHIIITIIVWPKYIAM